MDPIPFKIPVGVEYAGLVRLEQAAIVVEFDKWSWRKMSKQINEVAIPVSELASAKLVTRWYVTRLELQLKSMKAAKEIPSSKPGLIQLQFRRRYRKALRQMVSMIKTSLTEQQLNQLEGEMRRLEE